MVKTIRLFLILASSVCLGAPNILLAQASVSLSFEDVDKIKAQEFARALAQLKVQEVALQRVPPTDEQSLATNHAQQNVLEQELARLVTSPLRAEMQRLEAQRQQYAADLRPEHPKMLALQAQLEQAKSALTTNH